MAQASYGNVGIDLHGMSLLAVAGAWLLGILLGAWIALPTLGLLLAACAALLWLIPLWRDPVARLVMLIILWLLLGMWRYTIASPLGDPQAISSFIGTGKVEVQGSVTDEPALQGKTRVLLISVSSISTNGGTSWQDAHGQLEVQTLGNEIDDPYGANYGDSVQLKGKLQPPTSYTPPGIFATMTFPAITVSSNGGNPIIAALFHLRTAMANIIAQSLPQPEAALLIAILLGLRTPALKPLVPYFTDTGTIHLLVPSGFKVTILAGQIVASTRWLYEKRASKKGSLLPAQKKGQQGMRWMVTALVIACIAAYTILSGAGPAALRAGIMGILLVIAPRIGRIYNVYTSLAATALLMSMADPFVLWNVGFQLSFVGTLGIVLFTPFILRAFKYIERLPVGHTIGEIGATTASAQIATLPIVAVSFHIFSSIALFANILTVTLLSILIALGFLIVVGGFIFAPLGVLCGSIAWPFLWYVVNIVTWLNGLWGAYTPLDNNFTIELEWGYYGLLALAACFLLLKWPQTPSLPHHALPSRPRLAPRTRRLVQMSVALLIVLSTGAAALATHTSSELTITFLNVGPASQPAQGEAVLLQTPDGKTVLIDGGLDATSLASQVDSRLPYWQRSLDIVILTTPRADHLTGLQDIVTRYQIGKVLDAGMLHPNTGYALWRRTIAERNLPYTQIHQGATIALSSQVTLQILWPTSPLHKSSDEERDNGLIFRLNAPHLKILFLGAAAMSKYALTNLASSIAPSDLQADIIQVVAEAGKPFPTGLGTIVQTAHPSYVIISPGGLSAKQRKAGLSPIIVLPPLLTQLRAEVEQTAQVGALAISDDGLQWNVHAA